MGVNGLWTVVQPCARPTNLATLNRKRLAVDASIWIYQFLKAVRDKEGNALRNSHIVGFFRRVCKLLWFGILPVFVFDGGAPALKRETLQKRQRRREGRRDDAVRTAGKLLAMQMQRVAVEEKERRKRDADGAVAAREAKLQQEDVADSSKVVYMDEIVMSQKEKAQSRKFFKQDAYHLPELQGGIASMGKPDDPRIMSVEELEEYARQFKNGEDINLYDFSKIDFDGDFFKSLPPADRYNILNAARLRSRLRLGYSKDQLDDMFPDRMAFSRFQIERVKERNHFTQRLMQEAGMHGTDLTLAVNARIAGDKDREYILVKNEGAEGGWALGVVSKEKDVGEAHKPIDVDAIEVQFQSKDAQDDEDEDEDFEDVPIEGVNRLPRTNSHFSQSKHNDNERQSPDMDTQDGQEGSLFVGSSVDKLTLQRQAEAVEEMHPEEADEVQQAIALSLKNQHAVVPEESDDEKFEDVPIEAPQWKQTAVQDSKTIKARSGAMIAHIVNNRANAAVPKRSEQKAKADSDSEDDLQAVLAQSRKKRPPPPKPVPENKKNPFDGPLPFPKLDWGASLFAKGPSQKPSAVESISKTDEAEAPDQDMAGGFEKEVEGQDAPKPLPPWLQDETDIRDSLWKQQDVEREINAEDKQEAEEEARVQRREMQDRLVEIDSSDDDEDEVQVLEVPPSPPKSNIEVVEREISDGGSGRQGEPEQESAEKVAESSDEGSKGLENGDTTASAPINGNAQQRESQSASPEPVFEDVPAPTSKDVGMSPAETLPGHSHSPGADAEVDAPATTTQNLPPTQDDDKAFMKADAEDFSEPEDEELMMQMAEEAEEHARFASELNHKSAEQNREEYEKELRTLRNQQKKDRRDADEVTQVMVTECQALLRLFGIPYITAPMEAEAQCAELVRLGTVDGIVTDDSDTFLFGGTHVYKNMFNGNKFVECYLGVDLESELSLSREQLISLAQLLGSDYTEGLSGVGSVTAVEILSEFPGKSGLDKFREWWTAVQSQGRPKEADASSTFRKKFRKSQATKLFLPPGFPSAAVYDAYFHPKVDKSPEPFQWGVPNLEGLRQFLMATIGWSKERTDEVLVPVIRDMNKRGVEGTQSNITRFFGGGVGIGAKEAFAPRQRAQGSKRMAAAVDRLRAQAVGVGEVEAVGDGAGDAEDGVGKVQQEKATNGRKRRRTTRKASGRGSRGIEA